LETETDKKNPQNKPKNRPTIAAAEVVSLKPETTSAPQSSVAYLRTTDRQSALDSCVIIFKNPEENSTHSFYSGETEHFYCLVELMNFTILAGELDEDEVPEKELQYAIYRLKGFLL
jgi:hypothetical protein